MYFAGGDWESVLHINRDFVSVSDEVYKLDAFIDQRYV
jgi:hypothetical protein